MDIDTIIQEDGICSALQYADDACVFSTNRDSVQACKSIELVMEKICVHLEQIGLDLSVPKTKLCVFSKKRKDFANRDNWKVKVKGADVWHDEAVKFLGLWLHSELKWSNHIKELEKRCRNASKTINCLRGTWWGADPSLLLRIYRALIRSRIEYGGLVFFNLTKSDGKRLDRIQGKCLRAVLGYTSSTPLKICLCEAGELPLHLRFKQLAYNFLSKAFSRQNHKVLNTLQDIIDHEDNPVIINREGTIPLVDAFREVSRHSHLINAYSSPTCYAIDYESVFFHPNVSFKEGEEIVDINCRERNCQELFGEIFHEYLDAWTCYFTGGSKSDKSPFGGFAVVELSESIELKFRAPKFASIFTLEALAIFEAINLIGKSRWKCSVIFSDSRSVLQALASDSNLNNKSYLVFLIRNRIRDLMLAGKNVKLFWIPAHCGITVE
ncbi:GSCOCG00000337001-RA-CDS [Cotesia congregata]|nr:GSCOCG00000337001-RA-CDS [Cotesia congregata]